MEHTRRHFLALLGTAALGAGLPSSLTQAFAAPQIDSKSPWLRAGRPKFVYLSFVEDDSNRLLRSGWDGFTWSAAERVPDADSNAAPSVCAFQGQAFVLYKGVNTNRIFYRIRTGAGWTLEREVPDALTSAQPIGIQY